MGFGSLLVILFSLVVAWWLGQQLLRLLSLPQTCQAESALFATGLGLGLISYFTLAAGVLGLLTPLVFRFFLGIGVVGAGIQIMRRRSRQPVAPSLGEGDRGRRKWLGVLPGLALGITALVCLFAALGPETEFDALNHHLGTARLYIEAGRVIATPNLAWSSHPLAVEMLFIFGWVAHSPLTAKLFHFAFAMLTAAGCLLFTRKYTGTTAGLLAAFLFLASPLVTYLSQSAYVDLGLAFFAWLAVWAFFNWLRHGDRSWLILSGAFAGFSLGSKYLGGVVLLVIAVFWAGEWYRGTRTNQMRLRDFISYLAVAGLVFSPWLLKNLVLTGNPVAPFLSDVVPTADLSPGDYRDLVQLSRTWRGYEGGVLDYLRSPWFLTFRPDLFHGSPGWVYLFLFPVGLVLGWRHPAVRFLGIAVITGFVILLSATRNVRYFVPLFPWISVVIAGGICSTFPKMKQAVGLHRLFLAGIALVLAFLQLPWFGGLWSVPHPLSLSPEKIRLFWTEGERRSFLEAQVLGAGGWQLYEYLEELPAATRVLALTPVYQALTGTTVFMPPNSSPSNSLAAAAINLAQNHSGLNTVRLRLLDGRFARYWKMQVERPPAPTKDEVHPRLHYEEKGMLLEVPAFRVSTDTNGMVTDIVTDLGSTRKVDSISLLTRLEPTISFRVWCSEDPNGIWSEVDATTRVVTPDPASMDQFLRLCRDHGISYLILGRHPGAIFLPEYFLSAPSGIRHLRTFASYEVFEIVQGEASRVSAPVFGP